MAYYLMTDTGGGSKQNTKVGQYNTPNTSSATQKATTTNSTSNASTATKTAASTAKSSTNTGTVAAPTYTSGNDSGYSYSGAGGGGGGGGAEDDGYNAATTKNYLDNIKKLVEAQYDAQKNQAVSYKSGATKNLSNAENTWRSTYEQNAANLAALQQQNSEREAYVNQLLTNYYNTMTGENAKREQATLSAIDDAYRALMGNANEYYQNLLGTYDRSMDFVNQGYKEGQANTTAARDEALQLAQNLYDLEAEAQQRQTEKDLRGQYISYMNGMKNLGQRLSAAGLTGGATESSMLAALNGYEQNRSDINEARLAALGQLRQTQMQSDSAAQQTYLSALANLITNRTNQQLGVESQRASQEGTYADMLNNADTQRGNQLINAQNNFQNWANDLQSSYANMSSNAQNNFQNWASDLTNQTSSNNNNYAGAMAQLANDRNSVLQNYANMASQAAIDRTNTTTGSAYQSGISDLAYHNESYNSGVSSANVTNRQKATRLLNGKSSTTYSKSSEAVQKKAVSMAVSKIKTGKMKISDITDKALKKAVKANAAYKQYVKNQKKKK